MAGAKDMPKIPDAMGKNDGSFKKAFIKGLDTEDPSFYDLWPDDYSTGDKRLYNMVADVNAAIKTFNFIGRSDKYASDYVEESWRGKTKLEVFMEMVSAYEYAGVGEREVMAGRIVTAADELVGDSSKTLNRILSSSSSYGYVGYRNNSSNFPTSYGLYQAFSQLKSNILEVRKAAIIAQEQAQMKRMLTVLNTLEIKYRYWRSDPAEHWSLRLELEKLKDDGTKFSNANVRDCVKDVYNYVDKYVIEGGFFSLWRNCAAYSSTATITPAGGTGAVNVTNKLLELQSRFGGWQRKEEIWLDLMEEIHGILSTGSLPARAPASGTKVENEDLKNALTAYGNGLGNITVNNGQTFFKLLFKEILGYGNKVVDRQRTPQRCVPTVTGTVEDFEGLETREIVREGGVSRNIMILTEVKEIEEFKEPSQDAINTGNWETARLILENIRIKGEDSLGSYLHKQREALRDRVNEEGKDGFYRIAQILDEIDEWIERYKIRRGTADNQITQALAKWYNAVVDYGAQFIRIHLQEYINDNSVAETRGSMVGYEEIGDAKQAANPAATIGGSNWKIVGSGTRLRHVKVEQKGTYMEKSWLYPAASNTGLSLQELHQLKSNFIGGNKLKDALWLRGEISDLTMYQDYVRNLLDQYVLLKETERQGYDSTTIQAYVQTLRNNAADLLSAKESVFPEETKALLDRYIGDLTNLDNGFYSMKIVKEVDQFYEWFINLEKLNYDWRINSRSLGAMVRQLEGIKLIKFGIQMPRPIAEEKDLKAENVNLRSSAHIESMMSSISNAVKNINSILSKLTGSNKVSEACVAASVNLDSILKADGRSGDLKVAQESLEAAKINKEFWNMDDYVTYADVIDELKEMMGRLREAGNEVIKVAKIGEWKNGMASSGIVLRAADNNSYYFCGDLLSHIDRLIEFIRKYDLTVPMAGPEVSDDTKLKAWMKGQWQRLTQRYGNVGDCDRDQVAVIEFMNKENHEIELEFGSNRSRDRGPELLSAKVSGKPVVQEVKLVTEDLDRARKYYESWLDFERSMSFLVGNFIIQNGDTKIQKPDRLNVPSDTAKSIKEIIGDARMGILKDIMKGADSNCKTLLDLFTKYEPAAAGNDHYKILVYQLNELVKHGYTQINYNLGTADLLLDCLKIYKEMFIDEASTFQQLRTYVTEQNAYTVVMEYERYLFERYADWQGNIGEATALRTKLSELKGMALYMQEDRSWVINGDERGMPDQYSTATIKRASEIRARVTVNGEEMGEPKEIEFGDGTKGMEKESNLGEYLTQLIEQTYAYNVNDDPEAVYVSRLAEINSNVEEVLGEGMDYTAIFNMSADRLVPGGRLIGDKPKMELLIKRLEDLVVGWNREDESMKRRLFEGMNPDGVYFAEGEGEYVYQGESVDKSRYPKEGKVKTVNGEESTIEICKGGSIASATTQKTVKNRIMSNELLSVIDSLKSIYVNGDAIANVSEVYYRLQMVEYIYAVAGEKAKGITWHSPTNLVSDGDKFLGKNGCYSFRMEGTDASGSLEEDSWYICGMMNGNVKIVRLDVVTQEGLVNRRSGNTNNPAGTTVKTAVKEPTGTTTTVYGINRATGGFTVGTPTVKTGTGDRAPAGTMETTTVTEEITSGKLVQETIVTTARGSEIGLIRTGPKIRVTEEGETHTSHVTSINEEELKQLELKWFEGRRDLQGTFYAVKVDGSLSHTEMEIQANGMSYTSNTGGLYDSNGNAVTVDEEGFLVGADGKRVIRTLTSPSTSYVAYRMDTINEELLSVAYDLVEEAEIIGNVLERYKVRFANYEGLFSKKAKYLTDNEIHGLFWEELCNIGTNFGQKYEAWKMTLGGSIYQGAAEKIAPKVAQFAGMFAELSDMLGRHDVERYNDMLAYYDEQAMLQRVNTLLKSLNADGDLENFSNVATRAKAYYSLLQQIAEARVTGDIEGARQYEIEVETKQQEYVNAQINASNGKGNLAAYIRSLNKSLGEVKEEMKYALSAAGSYNGRAELLVGYGFLEAKCRVAEKIKLAVETVDRISEEMMELINNYGDRKAYEREARLMEEGNSEQSESRVLSMAELWGVEKEAKMCEYEGWRGDSRDAELYKAALEAFKEWKYFQKGEERGVVTSGGVRSYIEEMGSALGVYAEDLRKYEIYDGIQRDVYVMDIVENKRGKKIAGLGFETLLKAHRNWEIEKGRKAAFLKELYKLSKDLDRIIGTYDREGEWEGQLDPIVLEKIKNFRKYLGTKGDGTEKWGNRKSYIGRVEVFETYDNGYSKQQYLYKLQSTELKEIMEPYWSQRISFEEYKEKIEGIELKTDGPLNDYIEQLKDYLSYTQQIEVYHKSLLPLVPKQYAYHEKQWVEAGNLTEKQLEGTTGIYYRLIYGYGKNGNPIYLEDYDPSDSITEAVYISADAIWHGDYEQYGMMFRLMAVLYEKFTTQKNLLSDLLREIQANNEKIAEANQYLSKVNKVQAQAAKQGENARVMIPVDVIMYFQRNKIKMPNDLFENLADIGIYENSNFNKRLNYLDANDMFIEGALSYLGQGLLRGGKEASGNVMLSDLTNRDILELGTLKEIKNTVDYWDVSFESLCDKEYTNQAKKWCMIIGLGALAIFTGGVGLAVILPTLGLGLGLGLGTNLFNISQWQGSKKYPSSHELKGNPKDNLLRTYYMNRSKVKQEYPDSDIKTCLNAFTQGVINTMDGDTQPSPFPNPQIVGNQLNHNGSLTNGFQLSDWAAATNDWSACAQYSYLAGAMGDASGRGKGYFKDHRGNARLLEAFDLFAHQKYFGRDKGIKENLTQPDYDYNAILMMYKMEALARVYDEGVLAIGMAYIMGDLKLDEAIEAINGLGNVEREKHGLVVYDKEQIKQIKAYIAGKELFTDDEEVEEYEKKPLTQLWTEKNDIKGVLNKLYGSGANGLNADEVSLWSENLRIYIDQVTTDGQTLSTKMQRMMQRCNETTSLATQMLKSIGDVWKQIYSNIR
jgi:hypothetical protein